MGSIRCGRLFVYGSSSRPLQRVGCVGRRLELPRRHLFVRLWTSLVCRDAPDSRSRGRCSQGTYSRGRGRAALCAGRLRRCACCGRGKAVGGCGRRRSPDSDEHGCHPNDVRHRQQTAAGGDSLSGSGFQLLQRGGNDDNARAGDALLLWWVCAPRSTPESPTTPQVSGLGVQPPARGLPRAGRPPRLGSRRPLRRQRPVGVQRQDQTRFRADARRDETLRVRRPDLLAPRPAVPVAQGLGAPLGGGRAPVSRSAPATAATSTWRSATGKMLATILGSVAVNESEHKGQSGNAAPTFSAPRPGHGGRRSDASVTPRTRSRWSRKRR